jgi:hypothetical protein
MIDIDAIAEHIINWGDAGYNFIGDINEPLINGFVASYKDTLYEKYSEEDIREKLLKSDADLLMDDWDDILKDVFDVVGICPNCGDAIYTDNPHEYQYETGKTIYECNHCDRVLD